MTKYTFTDSDGDTLLFNGSNHTMASVVVTMAGVGAEVFVPRGEAIKFATALISTIPDYDHSLTLEENSTNSLDGARNEVMLDAGYRATETFDGLTAQEKALIDAVLELKFPDA